MQALHIYFYHKTSKIKKDGTAPIVVRVTIDGRRVEMSTGASIEPKGWDKDKQVARGRTNKSTRVNSIIRNFEAKITQLYNSMIMGGPVDPERLKALLNGNDKKKAGLLDVFEMHNKQFEEKVNSGLRSNSTLKKYKTIRGHVSDFIGGKYVEVSSLNNVFVEDLHHYLTTKKGIKNNTTVRYIRLFGVAMRWAKKRGYLDIDLVEDYEGTRDKKAPVNLSLEELELIKGLKLNDEGARTVKDIFLFSCLTSLAYVDVKNLTTDNIVEDGGRLWIVTKRQKTQIISQTPMLPEAVKIYEKYAAHREITDDDSVLPVPSNQQCNRMLKAIVAAAGIKKDITFHKGRHTFGRLMAKKNVPIAKTATMMGHTNIKMTQLYYDVTPDSLAEEMDRVAESLAQTKN